MKLKKNVLFTSIFTDEEAVKITEKIKKNKIRNLVYCAFENRFARSGGLASVTMKILPFLKEINKIENVILMTPYYYKISDVSRLENIGINFDMTFKKKNINVEILKFENHYTSPSAGCISEYYLKAEGFFDSSNSINDPYIYFENGTGGKKNANNHEAIMRNAVFFCKAVPLALKKIGMTESIVFHLQDWQTSMIALTSKEALADGTLDSCCNALALHNSYDSFIDKISLHNLIGLKRAKRFYCNFNNGLTALQFALQLIDVPATTVSSSFAKEFTSDILQTKHFAPHLQKILRNNPVVGINNGMFSDFPVEYKNYGNLNKDDIKQIKLIKRKDLLKIIDEYRPEERFGELTYQGKSITNLPDNIPIIAMSGRLDIYQKGFDVLLRSLEKFNEDQIKVILTPLPVNEADLEFFKITALKCRGNLTVFPFRLEKGYNELQMGSTFGLMPSIYEPFGSAVEYMVNGAVNIARKTGGLKDQIKDNVTGFLFREQEKYYTIGNIKKYSTTNFIEREKNLWVAGMADALHRKLKRAIKIYQDEPDEYYQIIMNGFKKAEEFNWVVNAKRYYEVFQRNKYLNNES
jgi:glycogen synthase